MSRAPALLASILSLLLTTAAAAQSPKQGKADKPKKAFEPSPLFATDSVVDVTLTGDWRALGGDRDTLRPVLRPGVLSYATADGRGVRIPVSLATRGHFRLSRTQCGFPPLRVVFDSGRVKRTLFAGQRALKLGTHCNNGSSESEQIVLREHLAYRAHNLVTDQSFHTRLARVRYVDARDTTRAFVRWGQFIESEREMGERLGGKVVTARGGLYGDVDESSAAMFGVWQYFIGNTDYSMSYLHNVRLVATPQAMLAVPYDFDFSGLVDTRYASPDPKLPIKSVRQRLYRGPCLDAPTLAPVLARFTAARDSIRALYTTFPPLDRGYGRRAVSYLDDFFDGARDAGQLARRLRDSCAKGS